MTFIALMGFALGDDLPARLVLHIGFGSVVTNVEAPRTEPSPAPCASPLERLPATLFSRKGPGDERALCIGASSAGLDVQFLAKPPVDFEYPSTLSCVTLKPSDEDDVRVEVKVTVEGKPFPVVCDIDRAFLYALSIERHASGKPFLQPSRGARAWHATIEIPWSVLQLRAHESHLKIAFSGGAADKPVLVPLDVTTDDRYGAFSLAYSPLHHFATPAPSTKKPAPRLHDIEADALYGPDRHTMLEAAFAQNDAAVSVQRASSQIVNEAPLPLPSAALSPSGPDTINTRLQPLLAFLKPSAVLGDQDLRVFADSSPFALTKMGSLASGYTAAYSSSTVSGSAFYGLQQSGLYDQAYALTVTIPTPSPRVTPTPSPTPTPTATPTPVKLGVAPPPLATPGPIEESKTSHDPLATISILDSIVGSGSSFDNVSGIAFGTNFYRNVCASEKLYCAVTFHVFGSEQYDSYPLATSPATVVPPYSSRTRFVGESSSYTKILSASGSNPHFIQIGETVGAQASDRFYAPASGSVTAFAPLSGSVGHLVFSYGAGFHEHTYSGDLLAVRLTTPYGDVFTNVAEQVVVPFDTAGLRGWTFNAGVQSESLSDRVAELQQGLVTSYFAAVYPNASALTQPVASALLRPQSQQNASLTSPLFGKVLTVQLTGGFQNGSVTACAPSPQMILCSTAHDHAATWALFVNRQPIGFGVANTANAAIPGDISASASRYFGSYVNAPGSITSFVSFTKCVNLSAAYTNAAYPSGVPLPQKGSTISAKAYLPLGNFGLESGYFKTTDFQNSAYNQSGYYALIRFLTAFKKPVVSPGCPG